MSDNRPLAVIDSGIGGLAYLSWIQEFLPQETLVYLADRKNFPYGTKTPAQVLEAVSEGVEKLQHHYHPKALVVACNTASVVALQDLRRRFDFPIVGVVPAVKPGAQASKNHILGILATDRTIQDPYIQNLIHTYALGQKVVAFGASDLVTHVEEDYMNPDPVARKTLLDSWAQKFLKEKADVVVLGCTHFLHISQELQTALGPDVKIVYSRDGVGKQTRKVLTEKGLLAQEKSGADVFYITAGADQKNELDQWQEKYAVFAKRFHLEYRGVLE